jgi:hypothetical protein
MLVGGTATIQALNSSGQEVAGLTWTSSDPTVVSLSTGDPPVLTALAAGHVTIIAGGASADVAVSPGDPNVPGTLPVGTVQCAPGLPFPGPAAEPRRNCPQVVCAGSRARPRAGDSMNSGASVVSIPFVSSRSPD